jgi:hypothetical protein
VSDFAPLTHELIALEAVQAKLAGIANRADEGRRHDLIRLRRELALQIVAVGKIAEPIFGAAEPGLAQDYRNTFSRMRSTTALHQANWPAVRLGEDMGPYQASALDVNEANKAFVAWVRGALDQLRSNR